MKLEWKLARFNHIESDGHVDNLKIWKLILDAVSLATVLAEEVIEQFYQYVIGLVDVNQ